VNIFGTVLATLVIVATIAFFVYKRFAKKVSIVKFDCTHSFFSNQVTQLFLKI
jgi:hypothetical protein